MNTEFNYPVKLHGTQRTNMFLFGQDNSLQIMNDD